MKIKWKRGGKQFAIPGTLEERRSTKIIVKTTLFLLQKIDIVHKWGLVTYTYVLRGIIRSLYISDKNPFLGNFDWMIWNTYPLALKKIFEWERKEIDSSGARTGHSHWSISLQEMYVPKIPWEKSALPSYSLLYALLICFMKSLLKLGFHYGWESTEEVDILGSGSW